MNRLQLATLLSWAGENGLEGRKRLQKVVYLLQQAGCPLDCRFTLHHYGPYSRDVADACDEMVAAGLVKESGGPAENRSYRYQLEPATRTHLQNAPDPQIGQFQAFGESLISEDLWKLELGSTILYFYGQTNNWETAFAKACEYKKVETEAESSRSALALAKKTHADQRDD